MNPLHKCTVVEARYGGIYEGRNYLAFPCNEDELPLGWNGSDIVCSAFWSNYKGLVGKGKTVKEAKTDLVVKLMNYKIELEEEEL